MGCEEYSDKKCPKRRTITNWIKELIQKYNISA